MVIISVTVGDHTETVTMVSPNPLSLFAAMLQAYTPHWG